MAYTQELNAWLDALCADFADGHIAFEDMKKAIREKVLASYRNGQNAEGQQPPAPPKPSGAKPKRVASRMFAGDWQCSQCAAPIRALPFQPKSTERLKCAACWQAGRQAVEPVSG